MFDADSMTTEAPLVGTLFAQRFRVDRCLGRGGMATVYAARVEAGDNAGREVALKVVHRELTRDPLVLRRFQREAKASAHVKHHNTVLVYEFGVDGEEAFIAMELANGIDLLQALSRENPMRQVRAASVLMQVCAALGAAHATGIIHRDLKPENIMLVPDAKEPGGELVKVLDFGIAKMFEDKKRENSPQDDPPSYVTKTALTRVGTIVGTPAYMSPEQCRGGELDARSDVYACGVLLYQLVTGEVPFAGETPLHTAMRHIHAQPRAPRDLRANLDPGFEQIILKALAKWPGERQQSASQLRDELRVLLPTLTDGTGYDVSSLIRTDDAPRGNELAIGTAETVLGIPHDPRVAHGALGAGLLGKVQLSTGGAPVSKQAASEPPSTEPKTDPVPSAPSVTAPTAPASALAARTPPSRSFSPESPRARAAIGRPLRSTTVGVGDPKGPLTSGSPKSPPRTAEERRTLKAGLFGSTPTPAPVAVTSKTTPLQGIQKRDHTTQPIDLPTAPVESDDDEQRTAVRETQAQPIRTLASARMEELEARAGRPNEPRSRASLQPSVRSSVRTTDPALPDMTESPAQPAARRREPIKTPPARPKAHATQTGLTPTNPKASAATGFAEVARALPEASPSNAEVSPSPHPVSPVSPSTDDDDEPRTFIREPRPEDDKRTVSNTLVMQESAAPAALAPPVGSSVAPNDYVALGSAATVQKDLTPDTQNAIRAAYDQGQMEARQRQVQQTTRMDPPEWNDLSNVPPPRFNDQSGMHVIKSTVRMAPHDIVPHSRPNDVPSSTPYPIGARSPMKPVSPRAMIDELTGATGLLIGIAVGLFISVLLGLGVVLYLR